MEIDKSITIEDLARMIQKGFDSTATKEEVDGLKTEMKDGMAELREDIDDKFARAFDVFVTKDEVKEIRFELAELRKTVESLTRAVDKLAKVVDDLRIEYSSLANQVARHEKWFQIIAEKVGIKLDY